MTNYDAASQVPIQEPPRDFQKKEPTLEEVLKFLDEGVAISSTSSPEKKAITSLKAEAQAPPRPTTLHPEAGPLKGILKFFKDPGAGIAKLASAMGKGMRPRTSSKKGDESSQLAKAATMMKKSGMDAYRELEGVLGQLKESPDHKLVLDEKDNFTLTPRRESLLGVEGKTKKSQAAVKELISRLGSLSNDPKVTASNLYQLVMKFRKNAWVGAVIKNQREINTECSKLVDKALAAVEKQPVQMAQNFQNIGKNMEELFTALLSTVDFPITIGDRTFSMEDICLQIAGARKSAGAADVLADYSSNKDNKSLEERSEALDQLPMRLMPFAPKLPTFENFLNPIANHLFDQLYPKTMEFTKEQEAEKTAFKGLLKGCDPGNTAETVPECDKNSLKAFVQKLSPSPSLSVGEPGRTGKLEVLGEMKNIAAKNFIDPSIAFSKAKPEEMAEAAKKMAIARAVLAMVKNEYTANKDENIQKAMGSLMKMAKEKGVNLNRDEIMQEAAKQIDGIRTAAQQKVQEKPGAP